MPYVFDIEANGLLDTATKFHVAVFKNPDTKDEKIFLEDQVNEMLDFMRSQPVLVGHNVLSYDFPLLEKLFNFKYSGTIVDTLVMSRLLFPDRQVPYQYVEDVKAKRETDPTVRLSGPHSVASWGYTLGLGKVDHEDWSVFSLEMLTRCRTDVDIQVLLFQYLKKEMERVQFPKDVMNKTFKVFNILSMMERYGWLFDKARAEKACSLLRHWMRRLERLIEPGLPLKAVCLEGKKDGQVNWVRRPFLATGSYAAITLRSYPELEWKSSRDGFVKGQFSRVEFRRLRVNSRDEMVQYLLDSGWQPQEWNYKTDSNGRPIRDPSGRLIPSSPKLNYKDPFIGVQGTIGNLLTKWFQCQHRLSLIEGLIELIRPDGRISQRITGIADTGRLTHGGIVNIPGSRSFFGERIRSLFVAKEGYVLVGTDSVSCQDRALANRANDERFTQMLLHGKKEDGTDGHSMNMHAINTALKPLGISITRDEAKNHGYGWKFGASDNKLGSMVGKGKEVGALIRDALASVSEAQDKLVQSLTKEFESTAKVRMNQYGRPELYGGVLRGLDGRPIKINAPHTILVYMLQSDEAIVMQLALLLLYEKLTSLGWVHGREYGFVGNIHDEFQTEVREDLAQQYAELSAAMIRKASEILGCVVLQEGDYSIGKSWAETH